jgi:hypothetical protein
LDGRDTELVKLVSERIDFLGSAATVFQFEGRQRRRLTEDLDLKIYELADFSLDGVGWACHHTGLLDKFS